MSLFRDGLDGIWIDAAARLDIPLVRGGDAYVHWDGRRLHIAADEDLDADDTVAQLLFHEICHLQVQGPGARRLWDWGLDNTNDDDAVNEAAAVRVQAHLAGMWGLRGVLFPTTVVRDFFEALPDDAMLPADDDSVRLAKMALARFAKDPARPIVYEALEATHALVGGARHRRTGLPLGLRGHRCGDCVFRSPGGQCRQVAPRRVTVAVDEPACTRWEGALDCLECGACCRSAFDLVPVGPRERAARMHPELLVKDGSMLSIRRRGDRCAALDGKDGGPFHCTIYEERPTTCRHFERAGRNCLEARRRVGLSV